jgi:hypothetical protein
MRWCLWTALTVLRQRSRKLLPKAQRDRDPYGRGFLRPETRPKTYRRTESSCILPSASAAPTAAAGRAVKRTNNSRPRHDGASLAEAELSGGTDAIFNLVPTLRLALAAALLALLVVLALSAGSPSLAHRSGCHRHHTCPSDHATYRWRGLRCVKPSSPKRTSRFTKRVRYGGRTYYCRR